MAMVASGEDQLSVLSRLQQRLAHAGGANLASIRAEIAASVAATSTFTAQARTSASGGLQQESALQSAEMAARRGVTDFMDEYYGKKILDPYLRFASAEDEAAFRRREAEREQAIKAALAENTPEGTLRAAQLTKDQLVDAGAYGADQSPDYQRMFDAADKRQAALADQIEASKTKAEPAPRGAQATADPLDAVKPDPNPSGDLLASLRAAGVTVADPAQEGHGVTQQAAAKASGRTATPT